MVASQNNTKKRKLKRPKLELKAEISKMEISMENNERLYNVQCENLSKENQLSAYLHSDFWQCMDTKRDLNYLENLWSSGHAPWKLW